MSPQNEQPDDSSACGISPLAACFPDDWSSHRDWSKLAPPGRHSAWSRRLSWRASDEAFAGMLDFLETHGAETTLSVAAWSGMLNAHLTHTFNRHFFFLLIYQQLDDPEFFSRLGLESNIASALANWKAAWLLDLELSKRVARTSTDALLQQISHFRGVPLCAAVT
jgi:hypothetical protein